MSLRSGNGLRKFLWIMSIMVILVLSLGIFGSAGLVFVGVQDISTVEFKDVRIPLDESILRE